MYLVVVDDMRITREGITLREEVVGSVDRVTHLSTLLHVCSYICTVSTTYPW